MEGIFNEVVLLVGYWGFGKLICLYDDNYILIDGDIEIVFMENVDVCFEVLGWYMIWVKNGNIGYDEICVVIEEVKFVIDKLMMIKVMIIIGFGLLNKVNLYVVYGVVLGGKEVEVIWQNLGWLYEFFYVFDEVKR